MKKIHMAIVQEPELFSWKEIECLGDLERLKLIIDHMPDEPLIRLLEKIRGQGSNNYHISAVSTLEYALLTLKETLGKCYFLDFDDFYSKKPFWST